MTRHQTTECREHACRHIDRAVVDARAVQADHTQGGGVDGQVSAGDVVALLSGVIAVIKTRIGPRGRSAQYTANGCACAALAGAVVGHSRVRCIAERQAGHEAD